MRVFAPAHTLVNMTDMVNNNVLLRPNQFVALASELPRCGFGAMLGKAAVIR